MVINQLDKILLKCHTPKFNIIFIEVILNINEVTDFFHLEIDEIENNRWSGLYVPDLDYILDYNLYVNID